jgi:hypothetical protein
MIVRSTFSAKGWREDPSSFIPSSTVGDSYNGGSPVLLENRHPAWQRCRDGHVGLKNPPGLLGVTDLQDHASTIKRDALLNHLGLQVDRAEETQMVLLASGIAKTHWNDGDSSPLATTA